MNIKPMVDRVLVKVDEVKESKGGIVLPDSVQNNELVYGTVVEKGPIKKDYVGGDQISIGSKIVFVKYSAAIVTDGIDKFSLIRYDDILATLN